MEEQDISQDVWDFGIHLTQKTRYGKFEAIDLVRIEKAIASAVGGEWEAKILNPYIYSLNDLT